MPRACETGRGGAGQPGRALSPRSLKESLQPVHDGDHMRQDKKIQRNGGGGAVGDDTRN